ncbi:MAG: hypothetical protein ACJAVZ_002933 [Afipia broomeae]|jgi:hypothetical protein
MQKTPAAEANFPESEQKIIGKTHRKIGKISQRNGRLSQYF